MIRGGRSAAFPLAVWLLAAGNAFVFAAELAPGAATAIIDRYAAVPYNITHEIVLPTPSPPVPVLTTISAMFVHGSFAHIGFNLLFLFAFGPAVEAMCGHLRFVAFYLACGIAGEIAQISIAPGSHVPGIGASGAIAGVLGAYLVSYPASFSRAIVIVVWAVAQFASGFGELSTQVAGDGDGVAYFVHIGGFCCGVLSIGLFRRRPAGMRAYPW